MSDPNFPARSAPPGVFAPRQERSTRTQAAILDAARALMSEGGIESLTISEVASRVGMTKGAFYARFRNKDALLHALFEETFEINRKAIDDLTSRVRAADADLAEIIKTFVPPALALVRESSALFRLFGSDHSGPPNDQDRAVVLLEDAIAAMRSLLREHAHEIPGREPDTCAAMLVVLVQGMVDWSMLLRRSENPVVPTDDEVLATEVTCAALGYLGLASARQAPSADTNSR